MAIPLFQSRAWQGVMYKLSGLFGWLYAILIVNQITFLETLGWLVLALVVSLGLGGIGYMINDWWDRDPDAQLGKPNIFAMLSPVQWKSLVFILFLMSVLPWLALPLTRWSALLFGLQILAYWLYAAPPFRLKEKGMAGVLADALYAHILPGFFALYTFSLIGNAPLPTSFIVLFILWSTSYGVRNIIHHQLKDRENDRNTGARTWISHRDPTAVLDALGTWFFALEVALFSLTCWFAPWFGWPLLLAYFSYLILHGLKFPELRNGLPQERARLIHDRLCNEWYERWFPLVVLVFAALGNLSTALGVLIFHLFVFSFMFYEDGRWKLPFVGGRG